MEPLSLHAEQRRQFRRRVAALVVAAVAVASLLVWGMLAMMGRDQQPQSARATTFQRAA